MVERGPSQVWARLVVNVAQAACHAPAWAVSLVNFAVWEQGVLPDHRRRDGAQPRGQAARLQLPPHPAGHFEEGKQPLHKLARWACRSDRERGQRLSCSPVHSDIRAAASTQKSLFCYVNRWPMRRHTP